MKDCKGWSRTGGEERWSEGGEGKLRVFLGVAHLTDHTKGTRYKNGKKMKIR